MPAKGPPAIAHTYAALQPIAGMSANKGLGTSSAQASTSSTKLAEFVGGALPVGSSSDVDDVLELSSEDAMSVTPNFKMEYIIHLFEMKFFKFLI